MSSTNINNNNLLREIIFINNLYTRKLYLNLINSFINNNFNLFIPLINSKNSSPIVENYVTDFKKANENGNEALSSSKSTNLFNDAKNNSVLVKEETNFVNRKRYRKRRPRKDNIDNIRKKIKTRFLNHALIKKLNDKLRSIGNRKYFEKFPQYFVSDINQKRNKEILNMTLKEIFEKKELYIHEKEKGLLNYAHNLKNVESGEIKENEEFKNILNKTFGELYKEYINSDEFKIDEIKRLKKKNEDEYVSKYIYLAENLIEYFSK